MMSKIQINIPSDLMSRVEINIIDPNKKNVKYRLVSAPRLPKDMITEIAKYVDRKSYINLSLSCVMIRDVMRHMKYKLNKTRIAWVNSMDYSIDGRKISRILPSDKLWCPIIANKPRNELIIKIKFSTNFNIFNNNDWKVCFGITNQALMSTFNSDRCFGMDGDNYGITLGTGQCISGNKNATTLIKVIPNYKSNKKMIVRMQIVDMILKFLIYNEDIVYKTELVIPKNDKWFPLISCTNLDHSIEILDHLTLKN